MFALCFQTFGSATGVLILYLQRCSSVGDKVDFRTRTPAFVLEKLTAESVAYSGGSRTGLNFHEDTGVPVHLRVRNADFVGTGYDRGRHRGKADIATVAWQG